MKVQEFGDGARAAQVSVVIPSYNRPDGTRAAVRSALSQTAPPGEIVIVDDGSQPPLSIADFGQTTVPIRLVRHEQNRGAAAARQTGIEAARGDYVAFLDSDDLWLPLKLEQQLPLLSAVDGPLVAVACGWRSVREFSRAEPQIRMPIPSAEPIDFASGCWFAPGSTTIVPRRAFAMLGGFDNSLERLEDLDWFLRFALAGGRLEVAPIIGAVIAAGQRAKVAAVDEAARRLLNGLGKRLDPACLRQLEAYLLLERAAARRNAGDLPGMSWLLLRSLLAAPRLSLHLRNWWP